MKSVTNQLTTGLGQAGVDNYSLFKISAQVAGGRTATFECFAIGINGGLNVIVQVNEDGTVAVLAPLEGSVEAMVEALVDKAGGGAFVPPNTYPLTSTFPPADDTGGSRDPDREGA